ncbi:MAG: type II secretion system F family protein [Deltaproteobacteria bacterium]|nr:type II secretion system F family protein [Deltaproteobacteria bacterium]
MGVRSLLHSQSEVLKDRLRRSVETDTSPVVEVVEPSMRQSFFERIVGVITQVARPTSEKEMGHLQQKLAQAGLRKNNHLLWYLAIKIFLALVLVLLVIGANRLRSEGVAHFPFILVFSMILGFYAPGVWLRSRVTKNQQALNRALPDALDLLVTCVEAGLGLDAAMIRVAEETSLSVPLLSNELRQASLEIRAGASRGEAFKRMAWRTGVDEIQNLSAIIVQTERFGTSVAQALRVMADGMRIRRMQLAEERAATVSVKMTIPLVFCIFPSLLMIILGPAIIKIYHYLVSQGG